MRGIGGPNGGGGSGRRRRSRAAPPAGPDSLADVAVGGVATITALHPSSPAVRRRLLDLGVLPGQEVRVLRVAPLGDPIEIAVRGFTLSLRWEEAAVIQVRRAS